MGKLENSYINLIPLKKEITEDRTILKRLIELFLKNIDEYLEILDRELKTNNWDLLFKTTHKIIPSIRMFGAVELESIMLKLETIFKSQENLEGIDTLVASSSHIYKQVKIELLTELKLISQKISKIVLAEDNPALVLLLKHILEKEGYELHIAVDGKEAMELVKKHKPDLVVSDIMMPFFSGLELVSYIRNKLLLDTPIIIFSKSAQESMILETFELGANDFISKPFSPAELLVRIKKILK